MGGRAGVQRQGTHTRVQVARAVPPPPPLPCRSHAPPSHTHWRAPPQTVKMGVQYSLWGGSVVNLGTERHRREYFDAIDRCVKGVGGGWELGPCAHQPTLCPRAPAHPPPHPSLPPTQVQDAWVLCDDRAAPRLQRCGPADRGHPGRAHGCVGGVWVWGGVWVGGVWVWGGVWVAGVCVEEEARGTWRVPRPRATASPARAVHACTPPARSRRVDCEHP